MTRPSGATLGQAPVDGDGGRVAGAALAPEERQRALERFLLSESGDAPPVALLRRARLDGYAFATLPAAHPMRTELREHVRATTLRHIAVRSVVARLVAAWRDHGIETLLFKGFHLAEFVYPTSSVRQYSDVDLLIRPEHGARAARIARALGLEETWSALYEASMFDVDLQNRPSGYAGHELMNLVDPGTGIQIDVHRRIVHNELPLTAVQDRISHMAWTASDDVAWEGTTIRTPAPVDAVIIGLALHRAWGRDEWYVKPSDFVDFATLVDRFNVSMEDLTRRAHELGCESTFRLFLDRCNPFERRLDLTPPTWWDRLVWGARLVPERGHPGLELAVVRGFGALARVVEALRAIPSVVRAVRRFGAYGIDAAQPMAVVGTGGSGREVLTHREWSRLQRAVKRVLVVMGRYDGPDGVQNVLALAFALRARGIPARVESGDADAGATDARGAWLEVQGRRVPVSGADETADGGASSADR